MTQDQMYPVDKSFRTKAHVTDESYQTLYQQSISNPEQFWSNQAEHYVSWYEPWTKTKNCDYQTGQIKWFEGGRLNVAYNCLDRHLEDNADKIALIWEGDDPENSQSLSYKELHAEVCHFANALKNLGIQKGDKVCIYLPMIPEVVIAMLACARIGAVHSVVFAGFSPTALKDRINDANCKLVITADEGVRGGKTIPLKHHTDKALLDCPGVEKVIVVQRTGNKVNFVEERDIWYDDAIHDTHDDCPPTIMDAEDPLFILYTSGSTGQPKGILHTTGGYLVYAGMTHKLVFDIKDEDIYWCTADAGWITGHSYIVYGPLANGATTIIFEGVPNYPDVDRFWQVVDKHKVSVFYTAPTAIRALMRHGDDPVKKTDRKSLRIMGTVGEPINPEAWKWYYEIVGNKKCPIVDTWWQTETGGILISPLPGATTLKPGSATLPFFGIQPELINDDGEIIKGEGSGNLVIKDSWPGQMRTIYGSHERFMSTYFSQYPGYYFSGDGAYRDKDGYFWISGRVDDVINVSGHRLGTAEIESALVLHPTIAEAAVVGFPHDIKGQGIMAYVTPMEDADITEETNHQLIEHVREQIGPIANLDKIIWTPGLPKTRSGKIMRRILRKLAAGETEDLGDTSTLADPGVVVALSQAVNPTKLKDNE